MTAEPMSAYRVATISPEAVTNDCKASTWATVTVSTCTPELPCRMAHAAAPPSTANDAHPHDQPPAHTLSLTRIGDAASPIRVILSRNVA